MFPELSLTGSLLLIYCCTERKTTKKSNLLRLSYICQVGPCKVIRDILGIWIPLGGFGIRDSNRKRDSGFLRSYAVFHKK